MSTVKDLPDDAPAPRLCHLIKWPDFDGYGFNLHGEKSKPGQYIGKVDKDSPAEMAGLKSNDRIIEVNGTNISNENHKQVVQRIKAISNETKLLVLDEKEDQFYKSLNIVVTSTMPNVVYAKTPVPRPTSTLNNAVNTTSTATTATTTTTTTATVTNGSNGTTKDDDIHHDDHHHHESNSGTETPSDEDNHDKASHVSDSESGSSLPVCLIIIFSVLFTYMSHTRRHRERTAQRIHDITPSCNTTYLIAML